MQVVVLYWWGVKHENSVSNELIWIKLSPQKDQKGDVASVSPSSERIKELQVLCGLYKERTSEAIGRNMEM